MNKQNSENIDEEFHML